MADGWKILDVPDVPDPAATQPPTRIDPALLGPPDAPVQSLYPVHLDDPEPPEPKAADSSRGLTWLLLAAVVVAVALMVAGLALSLLSGLLFLV
ncbi:MAG: hypothetical protein H6734_04170 [Alphaproteobacteria bacterium]|nr:hypothetical protein [Alphaproteobacteria bacterium]